LALSSAAYQMSIMIAVALPHQKSNFYLDIASYKIEPFVN